MTSKKEQQIDQMNGEQVMTELKQKRLPTFGTAAERRDRLRKFHGKSKSFDESVHDSLTLQSTYFDVSIV